MPLKSEHTSYLNIIRVILYNTNVSYYKTKKNQFHTNVVITQNIIT
jgi:hypothetical protein